jgi:hypothetical protein
MTTETLTLSYSELDVTPIVHKFIDGTADPYYYSGSIAKLGEDAGRRTWANCVKIGEGLTITDEVANAIRSHFANYGAWDDDEVNGWDDATLASLIVQEIAETLNQLTDWHDRLENEETMTTPEQIKYVNDMDSEDRDDLGFDLKVNKWEGRYWFHLGF